MSYIERFGEYAAAFEVAYASDDWSGVEPFFTEDAVYEAGIEGLLGGRIEGRDEILRYFRRVLEKFDRRFASRELKMLDGPREEGSSVWIRGAAIYRADGVPELVLELEETAEFEGDRIRQLRDTYTPEMEKAVRAYAETHRATLGIET